MKELFNFIHHIGKMVSSGGNKRFGYSFGNTLIGGLAFLFGYFAKYCFSIMESNFIAGLVGGIILALLAIYSVLWGILAQLVLLFASFIGMFGREQRAGNVGAFLVSLLSFALLAVGVYFLFLA